MYAYQKFNDGTLVDYIPTDEEIQKGFDGLPEFNI
jgi:tryptophan synthase beta chain